MSSITSFLKTKAGISTIVAVIVVLLGGYVIFKPKSSTILTTTVTPSSFVQVVSTTGTVVPVQSVSLAFQASGQVASVNKNVGDVVSQGEVIASLDSSVLEANLEKAQSDLAGAQAQLAETGGSSANIVNAEKAAVDTIQQAYAAADDAVHNQVDQFFTDGRKADPKILFAFTDADLFNKVNNGRINMELLLNSWQTWVATVTPATFTVSDLDTTKANLTQVQSFLNDVASAVNEFQANPNAQITQASIDKYRAAASTARSEVNTSISAVTSAEDGLTSSQSGTSVQQAAVASAQAVVAQYQAQIAQTVIRAPFDGQITVQDAKVGQIASPSTPLVSMISSSNYEIDTYVPEADIAKVQLNDIASITLDAYGNDVVFQAKVFSIDPAETVVEGVSTYKTKLSFITNDSRVKSGMTANIDIVTEQKDNTIVVPQRIVVTKTDGKYVNVLDANGTVEDRAVTTGDIDENGNIEITSGLSAGDKVVTNPTLN